jgi:hypothetical protein
LCQRGVALNTVVEYNDKRSYDAALRRISNVPPSSFGHPGETHSWSRLYKDIHLSCHRPTVRETGIHVSLLSVPLAKFCEHVRSVSLERSDFTFTKEFCAAMGNVFPSEEARQVEINSRLSHYFGVGVQRVSGERGDWRNDGGLMVDCGSGIGDMAAALHGKYKNEMAGTASAPDLQNIAHYLRTLDEAPFARARSVCPALLLTIAGPHMGIAAAAHARGPCVDPVVPMLPLLVLKQDKLLMEMVARALKATKLCVQELRAYYEALPDTAPSQAEEVQLLFPYPRHFIFDGDVVPFSYEKQVDDKLVFTALVDEGHHALPMGTKIVVKFTDSYCVAAHERCCGFEESAPRLFAHAELPNRWYMVVMEHLEGRPYDVSGETAAVKERLKSIVAHLHAGGLVHGDLRANNIQVVGDRVCLIDFDWSGRAGEQRYPGFMNHDDIIWPKGASDREPLECAHDREWLRRLL